MFFFGDCCYSPDTEIPDLAGKTIFITGGNVGLGKASIAALCKHNPGQIYLASRNPEKAKKAISEIKDSCPNAPITFIECDLSSLASVQNAVKEFTSQSSRLDILMCNAGIMAVPPALTQDGYEIQFGTNHVGHALLIKLLLPTLLDTAEDPKADVRIISLTSIGHNWTTPQGIDFANLKSTNPSISTWALYGQSKLANILYSKALAKRYPSITCASVHPGMVKTNLANTIIEGSVVYKVAMHTFNCIPMAIKSPEQGVRNQLWASTSSKDEVRSGDFYVKLRVAGKESKNAKNEELADDLWEWTEKELAAYTV